MTIVFGFSILAYFFFFSFLGALLAGAFEKGRAAEIRATADRIQTGVISVGERFVTPRIGWRLKKRLLEAGQPRDYDVEDLVSLKIIGTIIGLLISFAAAALAHFTLSRTLIMTLILAGAGFTLPDAWLARLTDRRKKEIARSLPDILDMLTISVEAGLGFDAAVNRVVKNHKGPLAQEFYRWLQEIKLGIARKEAWRGLGERVGLAEVNSFILAVLQADTFGVGIGKVLRIQSEELRVKRRQRAEEAAMKTPVKVVFPLVLCIFPALMIVILGPAGLKIFRTLNF